MQDNPSQRVDRAPLAERLANRMLADWQKETLATSVPVSAPPPVVAPVVVPVVPSAPTPSPEEIVFVSAPPPEEIAPAPPIPPEEIIPAPSSAWSPNPKSTLQIDFDRLNAAGFITPTSKPSRLIESFRIIKRNLLRSAFPPNREPDNPVSSDQEHRRPVSDPDVPSLTLDPDVRPSAPNLKKRRFSSDNANVVMITSCVPGEGKTFTALNLAMSLSIERDLFVLLIDADSHRRTLGRLLGVEQEMGLIDFLAGHITDIRSMIMRTNIPNLSFIPAGRPHSHGVELLSSKNAGALMRDLGARYPDRIILIDTSPVLATTEGVVLSSYVGQTVVVVDKNVTTKKNIKKVLPMIRSGGGVKFVLNNAFEEANYLTYGY
ncbi:Chromosome partitioning protein ParA [Azospirillaceae bacterium]